MGTVIGIVLFFMLMMAGPVIGAAIEEEWFRRKLHKDADLILLSIQYEPLECIMHL